jgi:hypothetical protein
LISIKRQMDLLVQEGAWFIKRALVWLRSWPWFVASIVLGLTIKENFPFSHWPMYSNFTRQADYVYVINGKGEPLATATFSESAPRLRKQFQRELRSQNNGTRTDAEIDERAGRQVLKRLARRLSAEQRASVERLGLVLADLRLDKNRSIVTSKRTVAYLTFDEAPLGPAPQNGAGSGMAFER